MVIKSFEIDYEGNKETIEYEDDLTFGELEAVLNATVDMSDVSKPKVKIPEYRQEILMKVLRKAPFKTQDRVAIRNLKSSVAKQIIEGVMVDFPLAKYLEDWMITFVGTDSKNHT